VKKGVRLLFTLLRVAIAVALIAYLGFSGVIEWSALDGLRAAWPATLLAFLVLFLCMVVTAWRFCVLLRPLGLHIPIAASVRLTVIGIFFGMFLPGATSGDAMRIYYATAGNAGKRIEVATVLLLDRATGMFGLLLWPLLAAPFFPGLVRSSPVFGALLTAAGLLIALMIVGILAASSPVVRNHRLVVLLLNRMPLGRFIERMVDTVHSYRRNLRTLAAAVGISLLAHTLAIGVALMVANIVHPEHFAWRMSFLLPLGFMANALPITPGGLGVGEAAFDKLFGLAGLEGGAEVMLGWRCVSLLIALLGVIAYLRGAARYVYESAPAGDSAPLSGAAGAVLTPMHLTQEPRMRA
jgi:uncharacterized protein (TIRG00374 family)